MASRKMFFHGKPNYIYPASDPVSNSDHHGFEFDEADVWNLNELGASLEPKKPLPTSRSSRKLARKIDAGDRDRVASSSLPVKIPDWSKILKEEYREHGKRESDEDGEEEDDFDDDQDGRVPPHEYLARKRGASLSVHEGIGRTLKGRDLRRVRNAIWQKTGFED